MKLLRAVELMEKYAVCPKCGSDRLGNGAGTLEIEGDLFRRTCTCGWKVEIRDLPDESTAYGVDCRDGRCEM